ncbi:hypothetical protein E8A45_08945 [Salmonella enterica]|nr:hypothetical protein [Salmonella enterica]EDR7606932.1 hypothetical protein [Salmonella enterica subsp. diarizonae]EBB6123554.1 hypothetical protein [Salmonella enterica]ECJ0281810.1 hypothetical protein [Salmonella enterica]EDU7981959.1 hypothetical protein [Salmonella enterica subsp. diarizonae]
MATIKPDIKLQPTVNVSTTDALQTGCVHINNMLGEANNPNSELPSYITGADISKILNFSPFFRTTKLI